MSEYVITINSTSDLPKEWVWERKIPVVPLNCTIGGNTYRDMYDLSADEFYGMLRAGEMAVTSQPRGATPVPTAPRWAWCSRASTFLIT